MKQICYSLQKKKNLDGCPEKCSLQQGATGLICPAAQGREFARLKKPDIA